MEFIWWAPFKDRIGSAGTFALAMRGSETVAARACPACRAISSRRSPKRRRKPSATAGVRARLLSFLAHFVRRLRRTVFWPAADRVHSLRDPEKIDIFHSGIRQ